MIKIYKFFTIIFILILSTINVYSLKAQVFKIFGSGYYDNQFLYNPAMGGYDDYKYNFNLAYLMAPTNVANGPKYICGTWESRVNEKVGLGLFLLNNSEGLYTNKRVGASYYFHFKVNSEQQQIRFGLSALGVSDRLNIYQISGDPNDPVLIYFNDRNIKFETDFGIAYTDEKLNIQAVLPNLVSLFNKSERYVLEQQIFLASFSYKIRLNNIQNIEFEPKIAFRKYKTMENIFDAGTNLTFVNLKLSLYGIYHSTESKSFGFSIKLVNSLKISFAYTTNTSVFNNYPLSTNYELNINYYIKKTKTQ